MKLIRFSFITAISLFSFFALQAQDEKKESSVTGNFKLDAQTYQPDAKIGADTVDEKIRSNSFMNIIYTYDKFSAGIRMEGYMKTMLGYDNRYDGFGIANRYATYNGEMLEMTAGNFYEQFGNGLVLRAYNNPDLGYDNSLDGARVKFKPVKGVIVTGLIGQQRYYWEKGDGIVRGVDAEISVNELFDSLASFDHHLIIGASFVSKYQKDEDPLYKLPENVGAFAGRINYSYKGFSLAGEYAYKSQDPSADNNLIYKKGNALLVNANYSQPGFGAMFQYKWVDNMSFRSDRNAQLNDLQINYLPAISKNHAYAFAAMYPYATQINGECGFQGEVFYKFRKGTFIGGEYGTQLSVNYSQISNIKKEQIDSLTLVGKKGTDGYKTRFMQASNELFYRDFNMEISKKFSSAFKGILTYQHLDYNQQVLQGHNDMVNTNTFIAEATIKLNSTNSLRIEAQVLLVAKDSVQVGTIKEFRKQDKGDWGMLMLEYTISPHWFFALSDQYNYGNPVSEQKIHYYTIAAGYTKGSSRVQIGYGKQREGILCVGGVCRSVPAAYGFNVSISGTF
jgi:hypothetical protein